MSIAVQCDSAPSDGFVSLRLLRSLSKFLGRYLTKETARLSGKGRLGHQMASHLKSPLLSWRITQLLPLLSSAYKE